MIYRSIVRPLLFRLSPERAHHFALGGLRVANAVAPLRSLLAATCGVPSRMFSPVELWGLEFRHPIGLAAGFDKNAVVPRALEALGFGFVEVGGITARPQAGNPTPRIFRLPDDRALINRMGLPNDGVERTVARLARQSTTIPRFANVAPSTGVGHELEDLARDFETTLERVLPYVDGVSVNISCPNTPDGASFRRTDPLFFLLARLSKLRDRIRGELETNAVKPLLLKVSPDADEEERHAVVEVVARGLVDGLVVANTTLTRPSTLRSSMALTSERGGLSGAPLFATTVSLVDFYARAMESRVPIVAVGGVGSPDDVRKLLDAGASLVEVYTAFVYEGPRMVRRWTKRLAAMAPSTMP